MKRSIRPRDVHGGATARAVSGAVAVELLENFVFFQKKFIMLEIIILL
jgi:hypothetical protein